MLVCDLIGVATVPVSSSQSGANERSNKVILRERRGKWARPPYRSYATGILWTCVFHTSRVQLLGSKVPRYPVLLRKQTRTLRGRSCGTEEEHTSHPLTRCWGVFCVHVSRMSTNVLKTQRRGARERIRSGSPGLVPGSLLTESVGRSGSRSSTQRGGKSFYFLSLIVGIYVKPPWSHPGILLIPGPSTSAFHHTYLAVRLFSFRMTDLAQCGS